MGLVEEAGLHLTWPTLLAVFAQQLRWCLILIEQEEQVEEEVVAYTVAAEVASCTAAAAVAEAS